MAFQPSNISLSWHSLQSSCQEDLLHVEIIVSIYCQAMSYLVWGEQNTDKTDLSLLARGQQTKFSFKYGYGFKVFNLPTFLPKYYFYE